MQSFSSLPTCFQISCMEVHYLLTAAQGRLYKMNGLSKSRKDIEQGNVQDSRLGSNQMNIIVHEHKTSYTRSPRLPLQHWKVIGVCWQAIIFPLFVSYLTCKCLSDQMSITMYVHG